MRGSFEGEGEIIPTLLILSEGLCCQAPRNEPRDKELPFWGGQTTRTKDAHGLEDSGYGRA